MKAWHIIDSDKNKYFLVFSHHHPHNNQKVNIQFNQLKSIVYKSQILPYEENKPKMFYHMKYNNRAQIMDWIRNQIDDGSGWMRLTPRVAIDACKNSLHQKQQYVRLLLTGFLLSDKKKKQYLLVSNDSCMVGHNQLLTDTIFQSINSSFGKQKIWPYQLSLDYLGKLFKIFYNQVPIKLKIAVEEVKIIKIQLDIYRCFTKQFFGIQTSEEVIRLTGRIFNILANNPNQTKNYYKIPTKYKVMKQQDENLDSLTDYLLNLSLTITEINEILSMFSLIINIKHLQFVKKKLQGKYQYRIRQGSVISANIRYLVDDSIYRLLQEQLTKFSNGVQPTLDNIRVKQIIIMRLIWEETLMKLVQLINHKLTSQSSPLLQQQRQFIYIQFPPQNQHYQLTAQKFKISSINNAIINGALNIPIAEKNVTLSSQNIYKMIKKQNEYDINKYILNELQNNMAWQDEVKSGQFMFLIKNKIHHHATNKPASKTQIQQLYKEIIQANASSKIAVNYILKTKFDDRTFNLQLLQKLSQSKKIFDERRQMQNGQQKKKDENEDMNELEYIEIQRSDFEFRYTYCIDIKNIINKPGDFLTNMQMYFDEHKGKGKINFDNQKIHITEDYLKDLQRQRLIVNSKINKIKNQFERWKFRWSILKNLKQLYAKIKFNKLLSRKVQPLLRRSFGLLKQSMAASRIFQTLSKWNKREQQAIINQIKMLSGIKQMCNALHKKIQIKVIKKHFMTQLKSIRDKYNKSLSIQKIQKIANNKLQDIVYKSFIQIYNFVNRLKKQQEGRLLNQNKKSAEPQILINNLPQLNLAGHNKNSLNSNQDNLPVNQSENKKPQDNLAVSNTLNHRNTLNNSSNNQNPVSSPIIQNNNTQNMNASNTLNSGSIQNNKEITNNEIKMNRSNIKQLQRLPDLQQFKDRKSIENQSYHDMSSPLSNLGIIEKSEMFRQINQEDLFKIKDHPRFTLQIWSNMATGFLKIKPKEPQNNPTIKQIFNRAVQQQKAAIVEPKDQLDIHILIKEKIVLNPFFVYAAVHTPIKDEVELQKILSYQTKMIQKPILIQYPIDKYPNIFSETFNCILKIGLHKNTTKRRLQLINMIIKHIKDVYHTERKNVSLLFEGQPPIVTDYSWKYNTVRDEIFFQFLKQIYKNGQEDSLESLLYALEIITRYYYPSPQFIYPFLHFIKSIQFINIQLLNDLFFNLLLFAQVYEKYKGNNVTVAKNEVSPKENQSYQRLQPRKTQITEKQIQKFPTIEIRLFNQEKYQFRVRNESIAYFKRKILKQINFLHYEQYFGLYLAYKKTSPNILIKESDKAIDHIYNFPQDNNQNIIYLKIKIYFPFQLKQINKTRMFYLASLTQERYLPWRKEQYQNIVALSMIFDQFQEYRIENYIVISNLSQNQQVDLTNIQNKYSELQKKKGPRSNQIEYFKQVKQNGFVAAKGYRMKQQSSQRPLYNITRVVIKPLQLCFYQHHQLKSSIYLKRIHSFGFERNQIFLQIQIIDKHNIKTYNELTIKNVQRIDELYLDLSSYLKYLSL